ncbi:MAG: 30S ribosomal protein S15 [Planctomycetota bacterium]
MSIERPNKQQVIQEHKRHEKDSGSPEVQIAVLTSNIKELTAHMQRHPKDYASRRGLLQQVNRRNRLMRYLLRVSRDRHANIAEKLGLRK